MEADWRMGYPDAKRWVLSWLFLGFCCLLCPSVLVAEELTIREVSLAPEKIIAGDAVVVRYRICGGEHAIHATAFARPGMLAEAPPEWNVGAVRTEPMYQVSGADLTGRAKKVQAVFPSRVTEALLPGPYSVFVAVKGAGPGWQVVKLGEFLKNPTSTTTTGGMPRAAAGAQSRPLPGTRSLEAGHFRERGPRSAWPT
ncbi:MAG: hypothetical protein HN849_13510 [Victivallales bacterium]|jgi:hypothetical protein|nr:hypothetical protein [Victivallales bacterium]